MRRIVLALLLLAEITLAQALPTVSFFGRHPLRAKRAADLYGRNPWTTFTGIGSYLRSRILSGPSTFFGHVFAPVKRTKIAEEEGPNEPEEQGFCQGPPDGFDEGEAGEGFCQGPPAPVERVEEEDIEEGFCEGPPPGGDNGGMALGGFCRAPPGPRFAPRILAERYGSRFPTAGVAPGVPERYEARIPGNGASNVQGFTAPAIPKEISVPIEAPKGANPRSWRRDKTYTLPNGVGHIHQSVSIRGATPNPLPKKLTAPIPEFIRNIGNYQPLLAKECNSVQKDALNAKGS